MILVDAHVHIYDCFDLEKFLDAAYSNFQSIADRLGHGDNFTPILLLAETAKDYWFDRLREYADGKNTYKDSAIKKWEFHHTGESVSLLPDPGIPKVLLLSQAARLKQQKDLKCWPFLPLIILDLVFQ